MNDMTYDMSAIIAPKSDQLNADDLIAGPITIEITGIKLTPGAEQPCWVFYEGDGGKPWKVCKSMARVMVNVWGKDAKKYFGHSVTLYRDPKVRFGPMETGGIRISHMTGLDKPRTIALTDKKGSRKPFTVQPLVIAPTQPAQPAQTASAAPTAAAAPSFVDKVRARLDAAQGPDDVAVVANASAVKKALQDAPEDVRRALNEAIAAAYARVDGTGDDAPAEFAET